MYRTSQKIRIINVFLGSLLSESLPSLGSPALLTSLGCPPTLCWSLGLLRGQLRFWSGPTPVCCCLRRPQLSELVRFLLRELSVAFYIFHRHSLLSWSCGLTLHRAQLAGRVWVAFLSPTAPGFSCGFISTSACGSSTGVCSWGCPEGLGLPLWGPGGGGAAAWVAGVLAAPGTRVGWQLGQQEIECSRRVWQPVLANTLQYSCLESPTSARGAWQATVYRGAEETLHAWTHDFFAWLAGTLAAPSVQGQGRPPGQELGPDQSLFSASRSWCSEGLFGQSFSEAPPFSTWRLPCQGAFSVVLLSGP